MLGKQAGLLGGGAPLSLHLPLAFSVQTGWVPGLGPKPDTPANSFFWNTCWSHMTWFSLSLCSGLRG